MNYTTYKIKIFNVFKKIFSMDYLKVMKYNK